MCVCVCVSVCVIYSRATTQGGYEQYWTNPGDNTPQSTNYTATCLPSRKLSKLDEPGTQDTAGGAETNYGPPLMAEQKQEKKLRNSVFI